MLKISHKPKKSLGQNFLKSIPALREMVKAGEISPNDTVLEIGPGKGVLTLQLLTSGAKVLAIEKDRDLFDYLQEKFKDYILNGYLTLQNKDILEFEPEKELEKGYKILANIPYNITGAILKKFLTTQNQPKTMVLMVQNEVARRIVAKDNKESLLSVSVKAYGEPKIIMKVPARYFSPAPKVDSAIISIKNISRNTFKDKGVSEKTFWEVLHAGFAHKRKKLSGNLKNIYKNNDSQVFQSIKNKRAEDLSLNDWIELTKNS